MKKQNLYIFSFRSSREIGGVSTFNRNLIPLVSGYFNKIYDIHISSEKKRLIFPNDPKIKYIHLGSTSDKGNSLLERYRGFKRLIYFFKTTELEGGTILFNWPGFLLTCPPNILKANSIVLAQHSSIDKYKKDLHWIKKRVKPLVDEYVGFYACNSKGMVDDLKDFFHWTTNYVPISLPPATPGDAKLPTKTHLNKVVYVGRINKKEKQIHKLLRLFAEIPSVKFNIYGRFETHGVQRLVRNFENNHTNIQYCGMTKNPSAVFQHHSALIISDPDEPAGYGLVEGFKVATPIINFANTPFATSAVKAGCGIQVNYNNSSDAIKKIKAFIAHSENLKKAQLACKDYYNENMSVEKVRPRWKLIFSFGFSLSAE